MSWKETDPIALWRTHSTLPVPESMVAPPRSPEENFANQKGTMRRTVWSSLNEMNAEQRKLFFGRVLHVRLGQQKASILCLFLMKIADIRGICTDLALSLGKACHQMDPIGARLQQRFVCRVHWWMPTLIPTFMVSVSAMLASTIMFQFFVYSPFIEHEGLMDRKALFSRIAGIVFLTGTAVPCMFAPVAAQYHNLRMLEAAGKPPIPHNMVIDLIVTCWESTRSIWRKLPFIVAINFGTAALASTAMIWGRDRLHNTMSLDSELIRTLMDESEKSFQEKPAVIMAKYLRNWWNKCSRFDKEIFFPPPMESESGPKWKEPSDGDECAVEELEGTYPYVTSSNSTVGGCCTGLGIPPTAIRRVIGVVKAYQTRVGSGPFPTELLGADGQPNEEGTQLQELGAEVGVTTGRKRRCGWLDLVLLRYSTMINGFTSLSQIKVAIGYELTGKTLEYPPTTDRDWGQLRVHYKTFEGWQSSTTDARNWDQLPEKCRAYLEFIQEQMGVPVGYIGVGKGREQLIVIGGKDEERQDRHIEMSWKETDPIALWRTHSTLPVPESMVAPPRSPEENFANQKGTMRRNVWSSLNEMNSEQRKLFFGRVLHIWPYPWERRAIKWTQSALVFSNVSCAGYIATKVSADVFMADPKIGWLRALRSMPTLIPTFMVSVSAMLASTIMLQFFVYSPFIEHEGLMDRKALFSRIAGIVFLTGTAVPCMFAPVAAQYHNLRMLEAAGKPPIPHNME
uniref:Adenylosuccinate synthetase n=1 Tax=Globodera pallida TaxID=36090 RepID=A0A183BSU8_GLOPA